MRWVRTLLTLMLGAALATTAMVAWNRSIKPAISFQSVGADISAHGGRRIDIRREHGFISQSCNGVCDDLHFELRGLADYYDVRVIGPDGRVIARSGWGYVTDDLTTRVAVGGRDRLEIKETP